MDGIFLTPSGCRELTVTNLPNIATSNLFFVTPRKIVLNVRSGSMMSVVWEYVLLSVSTFIKQKLDSIGPDMLSKPPTQKEFIDIYRKRNKINICKVLMDQSRVSGCGNYLKAEILYDSQISPWHIVEELSDVQLIKLYQSFKKIISLSYRNQGTTLATYKDVQGVKGNFSNM